MEWFWYIFNKWTSFILNYQKMLLLKTIFFMGSDQQMPNYYNALIDISTYDVYITSWAIEQSSNEVEKYNWIMNWHNITSIKIFQNIKVNPNRNYLKFPLRNYPRLVAGVWQVFDKNLQYINKKTLCYRLIKYWYKGS